MPDLGEEHDNVRQRQPALLTRCMAAFAFFIISVFHAAMADEPVSKYIRQSAGADTVIVFVHGFMGDGKLTWTNSETNTIGRQC